MKNQFYLLFLIVFLSVIGCTSKPIPVSGVCFITTNGGSNIELGDIEVISVKKEKANQFIDSIFVSVDSLIRANYDEATEKWKAYKILKDKNNKMYSDWLKSPGASVTAESIAIHKDTVQMAWNAFTKIVNPAFFSKETYFNFLKHSTQSHISSSRTNAQGEYILNLTQGEYFLIATGSRKIMGDTEKYQWVVPVTVKNEPISINLTGSNMGLDKVDLFNKVVSLPSMSGN